MQSAMNGTPEIDRDQYEARISQRIREWADEIDDLETVARADRDVPDELGDERTQVRKLRGQFEILQEHFGQLKAVETAESWRDLRTGVDRKAERLQNAIDRTRREFGA